MWCTIELNLGIFGGCVTAIRPFVRRYFPRLLGLSASDNTSKSRKYGHHLGSLPLSDRPNFTGRSHGQYSATLTTHGQALDNDSEEHILSPRANKQKDVDGIIHTVEFDVENSSTHVR
jgi:pyoverdine/dityrosine biosynthesis protein Dit1